MNSFHMTQVLRHAESESNVASYTKNHRTRHEGVRNRAKGVEGTLMRDVLAPQPKLPPKLPARTREPKNFAQENINRIRRISEQRQEQLGKKPVRATWNGGGGSKYAQVPSKVFVQLEERIKKDMEKAQLRRPSSHQTAMERAKSDLNLTRSISSAAAPRSSTNNFVSRNTRNLDKTPIRARSTANLPNDPMKQLEKVPKGKIGALPPSLQENKDIRQRAAKICSDAEKYGLPAGSYLMEEGERTKLVAELMEAKVKKEREIFLLPVSTDTLRARRRREDLEKALVEIDEGLAILSKPKVIVQDSDYVSRVTTAARSLATDKSRRSTTTANEKNTTAPRPALRNGQTKFYHPNTVPSVT